MAGVRGGTTMRNAGTGASPGPVERPGPSGRHALDEDAVLTPIFHALTRNGWRSRQHEPAAAAGQPVDSMAAFRRDPLGAPIPDQVLRMTGRRAGRRRSAGALSESSAGRHRQFVVPIGRGHH